MNTKEKYIESYRKARKFPASYFELLSADLIQDSALKSLKDKRNLNFGGFSNSVRRDKFFAKKESKKKVSIIVTSFQRIMELSFENKDIQMLKILNDYPQAKYFFLVLKKEIFESTVLSKSETLSQGLLFIHPNFSNVELHIKNSGYEVFESESVKKYREKISLGEKVETTPVVRKFIQKSFDTLLEEKNLQKKFDELRATGAIDKYLLIDARAGDYRAQRAIVNQCQRELQKLEKKVSKEYGTHFKSSVDEETGYEVAGWTEYNRQMKQKWAGGGKSTVELLERLD